MCIRRSKAPWFEIVDELPRYAAGSSPADLCGMGHDENEENEAAKSVPKHVRIKVLFALCGSNIHEPCFARSSKAFSRLISRRHVAQCDHIWAIGRRAIGIRMGFDEHCSNTDGERGTRKHWREFTLTAGRSALPSWLLHRMCRVVH